MAAWPCRATRPFFHGGIEKEINPIGGHVMSSSVIGTELSLSRLLVSLYFHSEVSLNTAGVQVSDVERTWHNFQAQA